MSIEHYTKVEEDQLWLDWLDRMVAVDPTMAESIIKGIIVKEKELGLIGPQRKLPEHVHQVEAGKE